MTYVLKFNGDSDMDAVQEAMDAMFDAYQAEVNKVAKEYNVEYKVASDIVYLRSRSRWTPELEQMLIDMAQSGQYDVNICEWP